MSNSKAARRKDLTDIVKDIQSKQKRDSGIQRQHFSGLGSADFGSVSSSASSGSGISNSNSQETSNGDFLPTAGGTMIGPIATFPVTTTISGGVIDVGQGTSEFTSNLIVIGAGGSADDLDTISNPQHSGQLLWLQSHTTTSITLKHGTGNIWIYDGSDYTMTSGEAVMLLWDAPNSRWNLITNFTNGSGGSGMQNPAIADLNMATWDIINVDNLKFDITGQEIKNDTGGIEIHVPTSDDVQIIINSTVEYQFGASALNMNGNTFTDAGDINFNTTSQKISTSASELGYFVPTGDTHNFYVNLSSMLDISSTKIDINAGTVDLNNGILADVSLITFSNDTTNDYIDSTVNGIVYNVNSTDEHFFNINGVNKITIDTNVIDMTTTVDLNDNRIQGVNQIQFDTITQKISPHVGGINYEVPSSDTHAFYVANTKILEITDTYLEMQSGREVDFGANISTTATAGFFTLPSNPLGFINCKVNGSNARIPYYNT